MERKVGEIIESAQKKSGAAKDRVIQMFKAEHEKLKRKKRRRPMPWRSSRKALNESGEAYGDPEVHQSVE